MNRNLLVFVVLCLTAQSFAFEFITIDNFATSQLPLINTILQSPVDDYDWYTPNPDYQDYAGPPVAAFHQTSDSLGGERDVILGYEGATPSGSTSIISLVNQRASVAFPLNYVGGAYFQWDGIDSGDGSSAFPGALLQPTPGIGSGSPPIPQANGQSVDFTSGGNGIGIGITISSDLTVNYFLDAMDSNGNRNELAFTHIPPTEDSQIRYFFRYTDSRWTAPSFDWTDVAAFQVRIWTFRAGQIQAIDTDFFALGVIGYNVQGNVFIDCGCIGSPQSFVSGEQMDLHLGTQPNNFIRSTFTDSNGDFSFFGLDDGTYTICLNNVAQDLCTPSNGCRTFTLSNEVDPDPLLYSITTVSTLVPPPDRTIECGACDTVACLGSATATLCGSGTAEVTNASDSPIIGGCTKTFQRTFEDNGVFATQTITIVDTTNPSILTPAMPISRNCDDNSGMSFSQWVQNDGGATFSDCSSFTVSDNAGPNPGICGSQTVTFTATDICSNFVTTTASYSVNDFIAPTFTTPPSSQTANCDVNGNSDFSAFNQWLATFGGAVVNDNCGTSSLSDNYVDGSLTRGCNSGVVVTFTATDSCGNTAGRTASFTIVDQTGPTISPPAQSPSVECNSNSSSAFNTWLTNFGNAGISDDCVEPSALNTSNDFEGSAPFGCNDSRTVTFTVSDGCGNSAFTTGTFTVVDTSSPTLTNPASPLNVDCENQSGNELNNWLSSNGGATATDVCFGSVSFTNDFGSLSGDCTQVPVTFTGCDGCNNCVRTTATYSIVDNDAPSFSTPPSDLIVQCGSDTQSAYDAWLATDGNSVVFDSCASNSELTLINDAPANAPVGGGCSQSVTVNFRVSDPCGNTSPIASADFIVNDSQSPSFTSLAVDQTESCDPSSNNQAYVQWRSSNAGAVAVDTCSGVTFTNNGPASFALANGDCFDSVSVAFTASDVCGNTAVTTASFSIVDSTPPTLLSPASDDTAECNTNAVDAWLQNNGGARASDVCSQVTFTNNFNGFTGGCTETAFVTFTATDACGLAVDTSATFSVTDSTSPVISPGASPRTVPCDDNTGNELSSWLNSNGNAVASDSCQDDSTLIWSNNFASAVVGCDFADVVFTVTDACGNSATTSARFTSVDNDPPTFNPAAQDLTVECNGSGNVNDFNAWVGNRAGSVPVDECALSFTFSNNAPNNGPATCGQQTVVFTVEDECGNSAATTATFTVVDTVDPNFVTVPNNMNVECDGTGNSDDLNMWLSNNAGATASDICASVVTIQPTLSSSDGDSCSNVDVYQFRAVDQCGNSATRTASFTIHDFTSPVFTTDPSDVSFECDGNGNVGDITSFVNGNGGATASDVCQGSVQITNDFNGNGIFTCASTFVTFTATDGCGNTATRGSTITITDETLPIFSFFPDDITLPCDADVSTDILGFAEANDVCSGSLFVNMIESQQQEPPVGDCPGDIIITRTFSAVDDCGNSISNDQVITVVIERASGPCDPEGCECDGCCPPAAASDCLPVDCQAVSCNSSPCEAIACTCGLLDNSKNLIHQQIEEDLPQCKPVYIYVNDDDDTMKEVDTNQIAKQRMFVTNEPLHESVLQSKTNGSSILSFSFVLFGLIALLFI